MTLQTQLDDGYILIDLVNYRLFVSLKITLNRSKACKS